MIATILSTYSFCTRLLAAIVLVLGVLHCSQPHANAQSTNEPTTLDRKEFAEVVSESGFDGGLIVHFGAKDPAKTLSLRQDYATQVHALIHDPSNVGNFRG